MSSLDHLLQASAQLPSQYRDSGTTTAPTVRDLALALIAPVQGVEQALQDAITTRGLGALGANLDMLAKLVGSTRSAMTDARLLSWVQARIRLNRSSGTIQDLIDIMSLLLPPGTMVQVVETFPGVVTITLGSQAVNLDPNDAGNIAKLARAAGVACVTISPLTTDVNSFTLDDVTAPQPLSSQGLGDTGVPATGGTLATAI
jgi:hypothetical protein